MSGPVVVFTVSGRRLKYLQETLATWREVRGVETATLVFLVEPTADTWIHRECHSARQFAARHAHGGTAERRRQADHRSQHTRRLRDRRKRRQQQTHIGAGVGKRARQRAVYIGKAAGLERRINLGTGIQNAHDIKPAARAAASNAIFAIAESLHPCFSNRSRFCHKGSIPAFAPARARKSRAWSN